MLQTKGIYNYVHTKMHVRLLHTTTLLQPFKF